MYLLMLGVQTELIRTSGRRIDDLRVRLERQCVLTDIMGNEIDSLTSK